MTLPRAGLALRTGARRAGPPREGSRWRGPTRWRVEPALATGARPSLGPADTRASRRQRGCRRARGRDGYAGSTICAAETISGGFVGRLPGSRALLCRRGQRRPRRAAGLPGRDGGRARARLRSYQPIQISGASWAGTPDLRRAVRAMRSSAAPCAEASGQHVPSAQSRPPYDLPTRRCGGGNWDYCYWWPRDSRRMCSCLPRCCCSPRPRLLLPAAATYRNSPYPRGLQVLYRLDGGTRAPERVLPLAGYRGSRPVRVGNGRRAPAAARCRWRGCSRPCTVTP